METFKYVICIYVSLIATGLMVIYDSMRTKNHQVEYKKFISMVTSIVIFIVFDFLWGMLYFDLFVIPNFIKHIIYCGYYLSCIYMALIWFIFAEIKVNTQFVKKPKNIKISTIPFVVIAVMTLTSPFTGLIYKLDENGVFKRGVLTIAFFFIAFLYLLMPVFRSMILLAKKENKIRKNDLVMTILFALPPIIGGLLQPYGIGYPVFAICVTLSAVQLKIANLENRISTDMLTGLNNRTALIKHLHQKINSKDKENLYVLFMDIDSFKRINDQYGHLEGDEALKRIALALNSVGVERDAFVSRYGGDEFVIVYIAKNESQVKDLCMRINDTVEKFDINAKTDYVLTLSIGYTRCDPSMKYADDLLDVADKELYLKKAQKKKVKNEKEN